MSTAGGFRVQVNGWLESKRAAMRMNKAAFARDILGITPQAYRAILAGRTTTGALAALKAMAEHGYAQAIAEELFHL